LDTCPTCAGAAQNQTQIKPPPPCCGPAESLENSFIQRFLALKRSQGCL